MLSTFARRAAVAAVPLITLPVVVLAAAPGTAQATAPSATIQFQNQAQLQSNGSIVVTLDASCNPGFSGPTGFIDAQAQQPGTFGSSFASFPCDDQKHIVKLDLVPGPFTRGTASAFAFVEDSNGISEAQTQAELKVS